MKNKKSLTVGIIVAVIVIALIGSIAGSYNNLVKLRENVTSAAGGRFSEARMAQRSKYGVTPPYFGHRKRGCGATSSPFVYLRQSCGDNYCFCFTAISLAFPI